MRVAKDAGRKIQHGFPPIEPGWPRFGWSCPAVGERYRSVVIEPPKTRFPPGLQRLRVHGKVNSRNLAMSNIKMSCVRRRPPLIAAILAPRHRAKKAPRGRS